MQTIDSLDQFARPFFALDPTHESSGDACIWSAQDVRVRVGHFSQPRWPCQTWVPVSIPPHLASCTEQSRIFQPRSSRTPCRGVVGILLSCHSIRAIHGSSACSRVSCTWSWCTIDCASVLTKLATFRSTIPALTLGLGIVSAPKSSVCGHAVRPDAELCDEGLG